jgi:hypothetical protein
MKVSTLALIVLGTLGCTSTEIHFSTKSVWAQGTTSVVAADFDRNGSLDLATLSVGIDVLRGYGDGTFAYPDTYYGANYNPNNPGNDCLFPAFASGDFDGDGWIDLVTSDEHLGSVTVVRNKGRGMFEESEDIKVRARAIQAADFNGDQIDELIMVPWNGDSVMIRSVLGSTLTTTITLPTTGALTAAAADFDRDGTMDLVASSGDGLMVAYSAGDAQKLSTRQFPAIPGASRFAIGDFNRDGAPDIAAASYFAGIDVSVYLNDGQGGFALNKGYPVAETISSMAAGDVNGDGILDLVFMEASNVTPSSWLHVLVGNGDGSFTVNRVIPMDSFPRHLALADLNGDGKADIVMDSNTSMLTVLLVL